MTTLFQTKCGNIFYLVSVGLAVNHQFQANLLLNLTLHSTHISTSAIFSVTAHLLLWMLELARNLFVHPQGTKYSPDNASYN